jgi:hypothetical protein
LAAAGARNPPIHYTVGVGVLDVSAPPSLKVV